MQDRGRATVLPPNVGATTWLHKTCTPRNMDKRCTVIKLCKSYTQKKRLALCTLHSTWAAVAGTVVSVRTVGRLGLCKIPAASVRKLRIPYCVTCAAQYGIRNTLPPSCTSDFPAHRDSVSHAADAVRTTPFATRNGQPPIHLFAAHSSPNLRLTTS